MPATTPHDQEQYDREREQTIQLRFNTDRDDLMRACPAGMILDAAHLLTLLRQSWSSHKPVVIARRFVVHGLRAKGFGTAFILDALQVTPEQLAELEAGPETWTPPKWILDQMGERAREVYGPGVDAWPGSLYPR